MLSLEPFTPWNELTRAVQLKHIPAIGPSLPLLSYIGAFKFVRHAQGVLQEGYDKVRNMTLQRRTSLSSFHLQYKIFRVAMINRWLVWLLWMAKMDTYKLVHQIGQTSIPGRGSTSTGWGPGVDEMPVGPFFPPRM